VAKYLVILEAATSSGNKVGTCEYTIECSTDDLQREIQEKKDRLIERAVSKSDGECDASDFCVSTLQILPL
jgi:hypothetical protein